VLEVEAGKIRGLREYIDTQKAKKCDGVNWLQALAI
jgi:hypothetical protein